MSAPAFSSSFAPVLALFTGSPHIASHVEHLTIYILPAHYCDAYPSTESESDIDDVARFLRSLKSLRMDNHTLFRSHTIPPSICRIFQLPTLQSLHLNRLHAPVALVAYAVRTFFQLTLSDCGITSDESYNIHFPLIQADSLPPNPLPLTHLTFSCFFPYARIFILFPDMQRNLRDLQFLDLGISTCHLQFGFLNEWYSLATLRHLILRSSNFRALPSIDMELPLLPSVQTLELRLDLCISMDYIPFAARLFSTSDYIERLPRLRQIHCRMESDVPAGSLEGFVAYMNAMFPGPLAAGILLCETALLRIEPETLRRIEEEALG
ncbi:hypothetical protein C8R43DRAFT_984467 [Mycena crocata]|nr:hypothetical protein C8R43DRAFT_984467 [Mycena crocata]